MGKGFVKNAKRVDPYQTFKFRVKWDGKTVLGVSKVSALKRTTEVVKHRDGGDNSFDNKQPGRTSYDPITMERGVTHDREFEAWAKLVQDFESDANSLPNPNFKKDLILEMMDNKGRVVFRYFLHNCWISEFTTLPELNANANALAIESLKVELESWNRDLATQEPGPDDPATP